MFILLAPISARASGHLPIVPTTQAFPSPAACVAELQRRHHDDLARVVAKVTDAAGNTHEIQLLTEGVEPQGAGNARYEATIWAHNGALHAEEQQVEVNHSYEHRIATCTGPTLSVTGDNGFTLSTLESASKPLSSSP